MDRLIRRFISVAVGAAFLSGASVAWTQPRQAQVAGAFYPADPTELRSLVTSLLEHHALPDPASQKPRLLIAPHAGYEFSGPVAARAFREIQGRHYDGVVVVGFTHRQAFEGVSVDDRDAYRTPLGDIPVDLDAVAFLKTQPQFLHWEEAHATNEHSLEVMLPFLQVALGEWKLVPILMGGVDRLNSEALADALLALSKRGDYLFVFSTDLSHYYPYEEARKLDEGTVNAILFETPQAINRLFLLDQVQACGWGPIRAALLLSDRLGYPERRLLLYANSGDTTGQKDRVVGYASIAMYERPPSTEARMSDEAGQALVQAARQAITARLNPESAGPLVSLDAYPELAKPRGLFVTLRGKSGELRGCIGRIDERVIPLAQLLPTVALDAALRDSRFPPVSSKELDDIHVEVSVLTPPARVQHPREIVAGRDGVVLQSGRASGVFLPQVWRETEWTRVEFLRELARQKAGLDPDAWQRAELSTFQDQAFEEGRVPSSVEAAAPH